MVHPIELGFFTVDFNLAGHGKYHNLKYCMDILGSQDKTNHTSILRR